MISANTEKQNTWWRTERVPQPNEASLFRWIKWGMPPDTDPMIQKIKIQVYFMMSLHQSYRTAPHQCSMASNISGSKKINKTKMIQKSYVCKFISLNRLKSINCSGGHAARCIWQNIWYRPKIVQRSMGASFFLLKNTSIKECLNNSWSNRYGSHHARHHCRPMSMTTK